MDGFEEFSCEKDYQKIVRANEKYELLKCECKGKDNSNCCPLTGLYMAVAFDAIERCTAIAVNTSSCLFSQFVTLVTQNTHAWPPLVADIDPDDVVFGVEEKTIKALVGVSNIYDTDLIFLGSGCASDLMGTDLAGVVREAKKQFTRPVDVVYAESGGFKGDLISGYEFAVEALVNQLMEEPKQKSKRAVNLLGVFPTYDLYWEGNANEIKRILVKCGIKVNCILTGDCDVQRIKRAPEASLNVVLSGVMGVKAAELMKKKFGVPYVSAEKHIPIGFQGTRRFISEICDLLEVQGYEKILDEEEEKTKRRLIRHTDAVSEVLLQSGQFAVRGTIDLASGLVSFLAKEMGWIPYVFGLTKYTDKTLGLLAESIEEITDPFLHPRVKILLDPDDQAMRAALLETKPAYIFGSTMELDVQDRLFGETRVIETTFPCMRKYTLYPRAIMGYTGAIMLMDEIMNNLHMP